MLNLKRKGDLLRLDQLWWGICRYVEVPDAIWLIRTSTFNDSSFVAFAHARPPGVCWNVSTTSFRKKNWNSFAYVPAFNVFSNQAYKNSCYFNALSNQCCHKFGLGGTKASGKFLAANCLQNALQCMTLSNMGKLIVNFEGDGLCGIGWPANTQVYILFDPTMLLKFVALLSCCFVVLLQYTYADHKTPAYVSAMESAIRNAISWIRHKIQI